MKKLILFILFTLSYLVSYSQNQIPGPNTSIFNQLNVGKGSYQLTDPSAWLEIGNSPTTRGLLLPRVADTSYITSPATGLMVYNLRDNQVYIFMNHWTQVQSGTSSGVGSSYIQFKIGDGGGLTPPSGGTTYTNNLLIGRSIQVALTGIGYLQKGIDYSVNTATGSFTLLNGHQFNTGEVFTIIY